MYHLILQRKVTVQTSSATRDLTLIQQNKFYWISIRSLVGEHVCTVTQCNADFVGGTWKSARYFVPGTFPGRQLWISNDLKLFLPWRYQNFKQTFFSFSSRWTVNLKKLRTLTLRMCKRFRCKRCCCSGVLILKTGLVWPATQGRGATPWCLPWQEDSTSTSSGT